MAGSSNASFLPLDTLGSGGKKYGESGRDTAMEALVAYGASYQHSSGAITLPMLTSTFTMSAGATFAADITLPELSVDAQFGQQYSLTLPMLQVTFTATIMGLVRGDISLPSLQAVGYGTTGANFTCDITLPALVASMALGSQGAVTLPLLVVAGSVSTAEHAAFAGTLPLLRVTGNVSVFSYPGRGAVLLPALMAGPYGRAALSLPMLVVAGSQVIPVGTFEGWCLNAKAKDGGVSRFPNFPFTEFTSVNGQTYGIAGGALYLLGGDTDNGAAIPWIFETGLDDMGRSGTKTIPYLYLDGIIDGQIQITIIDDRGRAFGYQYDTKNRGAVHLPHRRKLGNGIRTRSVAFRIESATGAYIELDSLEPEVSITQRSI